jgi:DNA-binding SARP family transcriptional activator
MLHVSLLGEQVITEDGTSVQARSSRAIALVAFLAARAGAPQSRQRIAGTFWPESTDAQALTNLRRELHHLRQILGDESSLVVTPRELCWRDTDTCRVDLRVFTTARSAALAADAVGDDQGVLAHAAMAVGCYKGDLLPGVYDEWLLDTRSELDRQCADLCDLLGAARARAGDLPGAAQVARRRIRLQPMEEVGYRTLMLLQADLGDRAGAVSTYHHCASVLERELGVIPDPVTRKAFQRLIADATPDSTPDGGSPLAVQFAPRSGVAAAQLVGRSQELAQLGELWRNAASGAPGLVLIRGGAGVGKSRIAAEIATMAGLGGAVVASSQ